MDEKKPAAFDLIPCSKGVHPFERLVVIEQLNAAGDAAVRWCPQCGSVVVDLEKNGRIVRQGGVVRERMPGVTRAMLNHIRR